VERDGHPPVGHTAAGRPAIRLATGADADEITAIRRESWLAAYEGIIERALIERATAPAAVSANPSPHRTTLVAVDEEQRRVVGYASYGPERRVVTAAPPLPGSPSGPPGPARTDAAPPSPSSGLTPRGAAGETGELYAIYLRPEAISRGIGRALMDSVTDRLHGQGFSRVVLWVLTDNARARRFYEKAGFAPDGTTNILTALGDVQELRYARDR
jgi:ribosomal protein S18 acetylase RimI-like enzyme